MTESDWLTCPHPRPMLEFLSSKVSDRKLRLFACACCRRVERFLTDGMIRQALHAAEHYADGRLPRRTAGAWYLRANAVRARLLRGEGWSPEGLACHAVAQALATGNDDSYLEVHGTVAKVAAAATGKGQESPAWHAAFQAESAVLSDLLRDIIGNPFRPVPVIDPDWLRWQGGTVVRLAAGIYAERRFIELPILADALEDAGCTDADILNHCRNGGEHARGCWILDCFLMKEL
jgi:hypothetical protein